MKEDKCIKYNVYYYVWKGAIVYLLPSSSGKQTDPIDC